MAIQQRRGADADFDSHKMLPGELAVTTDGTRKAYAAFAPGDVREIAFKDQVPIVGNITPAEVQNAVNNYLTENPVHTGATEAQAKQIELNRKNIEKISTSDTKENIVTFDSEDEIDTEQKPLTYTDVELLKSGEKHSAVFAKISAMFKNVRYLRKENDNIASKVYPVGSIYMSVNPTNPSELFGGTWEAWGSGRVPVGVDTTQEEFETVQKTGGEKTHTLTISEMPAHNHGLNFANNIGPYASPAPGDGGASWGNSTNTVSNTGGNKPHNNLQPYITCYMWLRTE